MDHTWDLIDAVARSPLLGPPRIPNGIDLAAVEQALLEADDLPAETRERLVEAARQLADLYPLLTVDA